MNSLIAKVAPVLLLFVLVSFRTADAPPVKLLWQTLEDIDYKAVYLAEYDSYYWQPTFGPKVKALQGKEVMIKGYILPVDLDRNFYVLSRYPFANCFFCGGAGKESVVDLRLVNTKKKYKTDDTLTFRGIFRLNADDIYQMNYILDNATEYGR
jgi:hypothetical protein